MSLSSRIPVIDLFAGPGGLGEGFSATQANGEPSPFRIALSIEKDHVAHQTLSLRAAFRNFSPDEVPESYYSFLRGEIALGELYSDPYMREAAKLASQEAWCAELGVEPNHSVRKRIKQAIGSRESVLIGGPPCQAYSLVGRSRNRGNPDYIAENDPRHSLYKEYLAVLGMHRPAVFVLENVKGLLSAQLHGQSVFERILDDLHDPVRALGSRQSSKPRYSIIALSPDFDGQVELLDSTVLDPRRFIVRSEQFGIPQSRHRIILIGVRDGLNRGQQPKLSPSKKVTVRDVIHGLPLLRSGLSGANDSEELWKRVLFKIEKEAWFKNLARTSRNVADHITTSLSIISTAQLDRGNTFIKRRSPPRVHKNWFVDPKLKGITHHETRSHIATDLHRYLFASAFAAVNQKSPVLSDFPKELLPKHNSVGAALTGAMFEDRFRVQIADRPSTTVTSHIAKDGHYYIHYDSAQCRSLTVREAARLQTFPDNYFFRGGRTAQYHQIGNAVPPLLARQIARIVADIMGI